MSSFAEAKVALACTVPHILDPPTQQDSIHSKVAKDSKSSSSSSSSKATSLHAEGKAVSDLEPENFKSTGRQEMSTHLASSNDTAVTASKDTHVAASKDTVVEKDTESSSSSSSSVASSKESPVAAYMQGPDMASAEGKERHRYLFDGKGGVDLGDRCGASKGGASGDGIFSDENMECVVVEESSSNNQAQLKEAILSHIKNKLGL